MNKTPHTGTDILIEKAEQTEVGHFFVRYFRVIMAVSVLIIASVGAVSGYRYWNERLDTQAAEAVFEFDKGSWKSYQDKSLKLEEMLAAWQKVVDGHAKAAVVVPKSLEVVQELLKNNKKQEAQALLEPLYKRFASNDHLAFFLGHQLSVIYDDLGKVDEAISVLEQLIASKSVPLKGKLYTDLGRLCKQKGDKEKAKRYLQYLIDNYPNDSMVRLAKVYLKDL